jgi:hypothetical protein
LFNTSGFFFLTLPARNSNIEAIESYGIRGAISVTNKSSATSASGASGASDAIGANGATGTIEKKGNIGATKYSFIFQTYCRVSRSFNIIINYNCISN